MWKFEPVEFSLLNDKIFTLTSDFGLMQRYASHLFLVLISGPLFIVSAFINVKKLIPLWFGIFFITILVGGLGFYFSDRVSLLWGWYAYGAVIIIINSVLASKLFPGIYESQNSKNIVDKVQEDEPSEEYEDIDEYQTPSNGKEFFLAIYEKLMWEIIETDEISAEFKEKYLLSTLRKNQQFLDISEENPEEIEKKIVSLADELIENAIKLVKDQQESAASSPIYSSGSFSSSGRGSRIFSGKYSSAQHLVATFENGKIYRGKYTSAQHQIGNIVGNKIYSGKYSSAQHLVATFENGKIYRGKYTSAQHQIANTDGGDLACAAAAAYFLLL